MNDITLDKTGWKKYRFGDVAIQTKEVVDMDNTQLTRYVAGEHMDSEDIHIRRWGTVGDGYLGPAFIRRFHKGDILYGSRRTYLKKVAIADFDGITANTTFVIKAKEELIEPVLLVHLMLSKSFTEYSVTNSRGSVNPYINWKDIADYEFLLPPKPEQKRIADLLWAADEMIEKEKGIKLQLENQIQSLINECVSDSNNPSKPLSDLVYVNPTTKIDALCVSLVTMQDVSETGFVYAETKGDPTNLKNKGLTPFKENDILFAKITPCMENGKGCIARGLHNGLGLGSTEFHVLRPKIDSDLFFCYYLTMSAFFRREAERQMTGSAGQKRVQPEFFDFYKLPIPSIEERKIIGKQLYEIDCIISKMEERIARSQQIKQELINKVF